MAEQASKPGRSQRPNLAAAQQAWGKLPRWLELTVTLAAILAACHFAWHHSALSSGSSSTARVPLTPGAGAGAATWRLAAAAAAGGHCSSESRLAAAVEALLQAQLPRRNANLSADAPLLYIHQRKAGGSSLRRAVVEGARAAGLPFYAACKAGVRCETFTLAGAPPAAIYAGHFSWGELRHLYRPQRWWDSDVAAWRSNPRPSASCLTNFRDPLARLESCYYYKRAVAAKALAKAGKAPPATDAATTRGACLSDLTAEELWQALTAGGEHSCLNEPLRMLAGLGDIADTEGLAQLPTRAAVLELALAHLAACVPVVIEEPRSLALARYMFPQLAGTFGAMQTRNVGTAPRCQLSQSAERMLRQLAAEEQLLYDAAVRRVQAMLAVLPPDGGSAEEQEEAARRAAAGEGEAADSEGEAAAGEGEANSAE